MNQSYCPTIDRKRSKVSSVNWLYSKILSAIRQKRQLSTSSINSWSGWLLCRKTKFKIYSTWIKWKEMLWGKWCRSLTIIRGNVLETVKASWLNKWSLLVRPLSKIFKKFVKSNKYTIFWSRRSDSTWKIKAKLPTKRGYKFCSSFWVVVAKDFWIFKLDFCISGFPRSRPTSSKNCKKINRPSWNKYRKNFSWNCVNCNKLLDRLPQPSDTALWDWRIS